MPVVSGATQASAFESGDWIYGIQDLAGTPLSRLFSRQQVIDAVVATAKGIVSSTSNPTVNDDSGDGYAAGWLWLNTATGVLFACRDATLTAAQWFPVSPYHVGYRTGAFYGPNTSTGNLTVAANTLYFVPVEIRHRVAMVGLAVNCQGSAGGNVRMGIYSNDPATGLPGTLLGETGSTAIGGTGAITAALGATVTVNPGIYWLASVYSAGTVSMRAVAAGNNASIAFQSGGATVVDLSSNAACIGGWSMAHTFGALPAPSSLSLAISPPYVAFEID